ncbi:MAG: hypothetical protein EXS09_01850 [Gemmataceae bacterium]|nr:hypothetical protein [Gemmataceae bacterium]
MFNRIAYFALLAFIALLNPGCSSPESMVSGKVTIEGGDPLKEGDIIFEDVDGKVTPAAGKVVDGAYSLKVLPGQKKVKIMASRPTKKIDPVMGAAAREAMIRPEFNEKSKLTADIKSGKQEGVNFEVKLLP